MALICAMIAFMPQPPAVAEAGYENPATACGT
jgi:hypothetical protein